MAYTSRVERRQQQRQQQSNEPIAHEVSETMESPVTVTFGNEHGEREQTGESRRIVREQKQIDLLVSQLQSGPESERVADTNLEILKSVHVGERPADLRNDAEYEQAQTKFQEATSQLQVLIGELQRKTGKRMKQSEPTPTPTKMFDLETAQTQELPIWSELHSQLQANDADAKALVALLTPEGKVAEPEQVMEAPALTTPLSDESTQAQADAEVVRVDSSTTETAALLTETAELDLTATKPLHFPSQQLTPAADGTGTPLDQTETAELVITTPEVAQTAETLVETQELIFDYENEQAQAEDDAEMADSDADVARQIAKDRLINKILIVILVILSVAVIITLGIGLAIIFTNQNGL